MAEMSDRVLWNSKHHESGVEKFYGRGVENYGEYHGGYLSFGLWENGNTDYLKAAENLVLTLSKNMGLNKRSKMLDVACGLAAQDVFMYNKYGCEIDALDVTWKHVYLARERIKRAGASKKIRMHHGTATKLNFKDRSFSHVMGIEGPAHFDTREDFFREAYRVLKPGGVMRLSDYVLQQQPKTWLQKMFLSAVCYLWHSPKENRDTIESYKMKLKRSGFRNIVVESVGERVIPGYYFENKRPETRRAIAKIRGRFTALAGHIIDYVMFKAFKVGAIDYVLVRAEK